MQKFEESDVSGKMLAKVLAGTIFFAFAVYSGVELSFRHWKSLYPGSKVNQYPVQLSTLDGPRLEVDELEAEARYRNEQSRILGSYAWVDERRGVVRIPIERAMVLRAHEL